MQHSDLNKRQIDELSAFRNTLAMQEKYLFSGTKQTIIRRLQLLVNRTNRMIALLEGKADED